MASRIAEPPPQTIGNYEVIALLGAGGMSHVYKARNPATGELVAIKVPQERLVKNPVSLKRFEQEFGVARLLEHPHLVRVLQFAYADGKPYIVMEFIEGRSLGDRIRREGPLPEAESIRIIAQAATALQAAHKRKIIHRDVKPDNILLAADGRVKLADLGLAKDEEADHDLTRPMRGLGTPYFIAPEQFNDAKHADARCDVYSLAATPRKLVPSLSERVERAICRALSADPEARPTTCRQFIQELRGSKAPPATNPGATSAPAHPSATIPRRPAIERRAHVRFGSRLKGTCRPLAAERKWSWTAKVRDISASGVGLLINRRFEPGTVLRVKLPGAASRRLYLVRVVRVQAHSPPDVDHRLRLPTPPER
jgi:serine/threonine protein kinase